MNNNYKFIFIISIFYLLLATSASANQLPIANAGQDLYVNSGQTIVLQGSGYDPDGWSISYSWSCNGGALSNYNISQPTFTAPNTYGQTNYNCSLTVTDNYGASNSDNITIYVNYNSGNYGWLLVNKKTINLSSGNLYWSETINANPYDILSFAITLQATGGRDIHNIVVRDILPANLIYKGNLTVNASLNYFGNPFSGINIGTIPANGVAVVAYQAQVAGPENFSYGVTTLSNTATVSSDETNNQIDNATVIVNKSLVYGATYINTGFNDNFFTDSFLLPLSFIMIGLWFYFSGRAYKLADWLKSKNA